MEMTAFCVMPVFSDHMVLQREKNIHIFGEGQDGRRVTVTLCQKEQVISTRETICEKGKWLAILPPVEAGLDFTLCVESPEYQGTKAERILFSDVAVGEVWLAGGQSNMELELQNCAGGRESLAEDVDPNVRFYYTQKYSFMDEKFFEEEKKTGWSEFSAQNAKCWSAVGYYYAKKLAADLGVTVGILGCNWGGTSASAWMSREALLEDRDTATYVEEYDRAVEGKTVEEQVKAYDDYVAFHAVWEQKCNACYARDPEISWDDIQKEIGVCTWPGPMNCKNPFRPSGLYECMLQRICPYSMRGFLYYQGESDDHKPQTYYKLFTRMIREWREDFLDREMPILFVQLTMHMYKQDPDFKNWPVIREAQMDTYQTMKNTGIAVIIDCGEFNNIHPLDKKSVGERLELQALHQVYHQIDADHAFGPIYKRAVYHENCIELFFEHASKGFVWKDDEKGNQAELCQGVIPKDSGFEIAGRDGVFQKAEVSIEYDRMFVSAEGLQNPAHVRYLWTNYAKVSLFGKNGLPVAPFRTR